MSSNNTQYSTKTRHSCTVYVQVYTSTYACDFAKLDEAVKDQPVSSTRAVMLHQPMVLALACYPHHSESSHTRSDLSRALPCTRALRHCITSTLLASFDTHIVDNYL
jgi:hypothetical protein